MANPFADLAARLDRLPGHLGEIADGIRLAIKVAAIDPEMSLTRTRKVLESILHDVFEKAVGEPPGSRPLLELTQRLVKDKHLPLREAAYVNIVRELGNAGTHGSGERLTREDVAQSISQLLIIVDWYDARSGGGRDAAIAGPSGARKVGAESTLEALGPLLEGVCVPVGGLLGLYRECAPTGWEPAPASHEPLLMLGRCVESLARAPKQAKDGLFPLHRFVKGLTERVDAETALALDGWLATSMAELGVDPIEAGRPALPKPPPDPACFLLVQVSPRLYEAGHYGVKAWLFGTGDPACLLAGEESLSLDQVRRRLDDLRLDLFRRVADPARVWVELLLPRDLLCVDVDQWRVEVDFLEEIPLGVEHRLVVRSLERASRPRAALALQARGKALTRKLEGRDGEALWIGEDQAGGLGLYTTLKDAQEVVGAALGAAPHPSPRDPKVDVLNTLFEAGLPVVVWSRRPAGAEPASTRAALLDLLGHEPFGGVPDRVWELRKQAIRSDDGGHIGRHLSLLWDDPSRTSPDFEPGHRLRAPSRE